MANESHDLVTLAWEVVGRAEVPYHGPVVDGDRILTCNLSNLAVSRWHQGQWSTVVSQEDGVKLNGDWNFMGAMLAHPKGVTAVGEKGQLFRLERDHWRSLAPQARVFRQRRFFTATFLPDLESIVVYGGQNAKTERNLAETMLYREGKWRRIAKRSKAPAGSNKSDSWAALCTSPDGSTVRRYTNSEVAELRDDEWVSIEIPGYRTRKQEQFAHGSITVHDPASTTTLELRSRFREVLAVGPKRTRRVAMIVAPPGTDDDSIDNAHVHASTFDTRTRCLYATHVGGISGLLKLDLGPALSFG